MSDQQRARLAALERCVGSGDAAGQGHDVPHGQFGCRNDVGGRGIHDHDAGLGGCLDVHIVQTHTRAGDDLQVLGGRNGFCVDLGCGAHEDGVNICNRGQQLGAVRTVGLANFEIGTQGRNGCGREFFGQ